MISKACKYAIRAAILVASKARDGVKLNVKDIAREVDAPEAFTAKILQILNRHKIITSLKGPYGGFFIERHQLEQPIINIVQAIDGMGLFEECGLGLKHCSDAYPCPMHHKYKVAREAMRNAFQQTSIGQMAENLKNGVFYLNNPELE